MTTLVFNRLRGRDLGVSLLAAGLALWAVLTLARFYGVRILPFGSLSILLVPPLLTLAAVRRREPTSGLALAAVFSWTVIVAIGLAPLYTDSLKLVLAIPALVVCGLFARRFTGLCMAGVVFIAGAYGTLDAYIGYHTATFADGMIGGLWMVAIGQVVFSRREFPLRPSPGMILVAAYIVMTGIAVVIMPPFENGIRGFRLSTLHISVLLVIGCGSWRAATLVGVGRACALICTLVGAYATLRYFTGPTATESATNHSSTFFTKYNQIDAGEDKVQGSLPNGQHLGVWMACAIPFLAAMALAWRGRWRLVAAAGIPLSLIGLLGSAQRTGFAAVIAGCLTITIARLLSRGFRGPRFAVALAAVLALLVAATVVYPSVVDKPEERQRYANILTPSRDTPFQERLIKWRAVLAELDGHPFGFGVGSGDAEAMPHRFMDIASYNIDSSYLMLAYGQGIAVAAFFVVALLVLLAELLRHAVWTRGPSGAAYATAAAGTLVAIMVEMFSANHVEKPAMMAGWVFVGLGVAQYGARRGAEQVHDSAVA